MTKPAQKRSVDLQIIAEWIEPRARVLDLGCGRGVLLEYLAQTKQAVGVGVDLEFDKISACVRRGLSAYQGDMLGYMRAMPDDQFDHVIFSRSLEELPEPGQAIREGLRLARRVTVTFVNHAFWRNRLSGVLLGRKPRNAVYRQAWADSRPANPVTIADFEAYCAEAGIRVARRVHLCGDWKRPAKWWPNLLGGYALYELTR